MENRKLGRVEKDEGIYGLRVRQFLETWGREGKNLNPLIKCLWNIGHKGRERKVLKVYLYAMNATTMIF